MIIRKTRTYRTKLETKKPRQCRGFLLGSYVIIDSQDLQVTALH